MAAAWKQIDVFPIILSCMVDISRRRRWISHGELVEHLLKSHMQQIRLVCSENPTVETVSNMAAWFSQKVTAYQNGHLSERYAAISTVREVIAKFDRHKDRSSYSYRLRATSETEMHTL